VNDVTNDGYSGRADETTGAEEFNALTFLVNQVINSKWTVTLCLVKSVQGGGINSPAIVSVQPMINQVDGTGNATAHGTITNIPVLRLQGGNNAVIIDPMVGDIGILACASRDISSVKANQAVSNPGSLRAFDPADGIYIGGLLNKAPTQYVLFSQNGVKIVDANNNVIETKAAGVSINGLLINQQGQVAGNLPVTGNLQIAGTITSLPGGTFAGNIITTGAIQGTSVSNGTVDLSAHHHIAPAGGGPTGGALP
jgi:Phage protein Gp138 N-terminal domain